MNWIHLDIDIPFSDLPAWLEEHFPSNSRGCTSCQRLPWSVSFIQWVIIRTFDANLILSGYLWSFISCPMDRTPQLCVLVQGNYVGFEQHMHSRPCIGVLVHQPIYLDDPRDLIPVLSFHAVISTSLGMGSYAEEQCPPCCSRNRSEGLMLMLWSLSLEWRLIEECGSRIFKTIDSPSNLHACRHDLIEFFKHTLMYSLDYRIDYTPPTACWSLCDFSERALREPY